MRKPNEVEIARLVPALEALKALRETYLDAEDNYLRLVGAIALECKAPRGASLVESGWQWGRQTTGPDGKPTLEIVQPDEVE